jgi:murein L,D-transpeptidase YafK
MKYAVFHQAPILTTMTRRLRILATLLLLTSPGVMDASAAEITISKAKRTLSFQEQGMTRNFKIALGLSPVGAKSARGDRKTPEGIYFVTHKNPASKFHLSLGLNYPNPHDAAVGLKSRKISHADYLAIEKAHQSKAHPPQATPLGGDIYIHGGGTQTDWTWGCIALSNKDVEFLFQHVQIGDKVTILE